MIRFFTWRRARGLGLLAVLAALPLGGCAKKVTSVDPSYVQIEGQPNLAAKLVAWREAPLDVITYRDSTIASQNGQIQTVFVGQSEADPTPRGALRTQILDGTAASGYQMFARDANGGFRQIRDFTLVSPRKWTESNWELYALDDAQPSGYSPPTYQARGIVAGTATTRSPLTNPAAVLTVPTPTIGYTGDKAPKDSLFTIKWTRDPAATGYWIHIYQFLSTLTNDAKLLTGAPTPIVNDRVNDIFIGYVAATASSEQSYRLGDPGAIVLVRRLTLHGQQYLVRITGVDANGQLSSYSPGDSLRLPSETGTFDDGTYTKSAMGASIVAPSLK